ncbi:LexA family transcriptional regulator [Wielerella bovis]|uniref:LexA family transcriptional regulator n=1 Tax=Wielerella bovis TaxID=2917790 RepID=UPI002019AAA0|nr:XRE family transcriptional regulator [Wielerella bovis]ULJ66654.1 XRE family transcriptional regulator [Wielerella bovis]
MAESLEVKHPEFAERFTQSREKSGLSLSQLSKETDISYEMLRRYSEGFAMPRTKSMEMIAEKLGVSAAWLQFGDSYMPSAGAIAVQENTDITYTHREILLYDYKLSAGKGECNFVWVTNHKEDPLVFREQWFRAKGLFPEDLRAMYVKGNSMSPDLNNWDTVIIDISDTELVDGEIYACVFNEKFFIKRLKHTANGIELISSNPDYEPIQVSFEQAERFQVLGRMVWRGG